MIIKELPKEDFELAKQLYCECFQKNYQKTTLDLMGVILGMYEQDTLIGIAQIDYINNVFENKKIGYINSFCIKPDYQHQGYGDFFLKECIHIIKNNGGNMINMTSNKNRVYAHKLYEKNDFEVVDTILFKKEL